MLQILIIMIALGALGILMFVALPPDYKWGRDTEDNVDAPTDNAFWTQLKPVAGGNNGPTQITVAPPYIILGVPLGPGAASQRRGPDPYLHPDHVRVLLGIRSIKAVRPGHHAGLVCWLGWASDPWPYTVGISGLGIDSSP